MRNLVFMLVTAACLSGCGKFLDKFSRIDNSYTKVYLSQRSPDATTPLTGGLMIYFINQDLEKSGRAFGFATDTAANSQPVVLANGRYKVYAYGWDGTNPLEGNVRCGYGDLGAVVTLTGVATTVSIDINKTTCGFGNTNDFGQQYQSNDPSPLNNFDTMNLQLCTGTAYPTCNAVTSGTWYVRTQLLGGDKPSGGVFSEVANYSLTSACSSGGSGSFSTNFRVPVGGTPFTPPVRVNFYADSSCSQAVSGTYLFADGLRDYGSVASGSNFYLDMPASNTYYYLRLYKNF